MNGSVTVSVRSPDFQSSFLAMSYFWGARGDQLAVPLSGVGVGLRPAAADALSRLCHAERSERAKALGAELGRLAIALDQRGLWR